MEALVGELDSINVVVEDRIWMKAAKSWRISLKLPVDRPLLPVVLSGMIDQKVRVMIGMTLIDPACIMDVKYQKKSFNLVIENVYEHQNGIGPFITQMLGKDADLSITKTSGEPQPAVCNQKQSQGEEQIGSANKELLKGLHILFQNVKFQEFICYHYRPDFPPETPPYGYVHISKADVFTAAGCKSAFKSLNGVTTCRDLTDENINDWRKGFNTWINGGRP